MLMCFLRHRTRLVFAAVLVATSLVGCSQERDIGGVIVEGVVTVAGQRVGGMDIEFVCAANGHGSLAVVQQDGTFKTQFKLPAGEYRVTFLKSEKPGHTGDGPPPMLSIPKVIPKKYCDASTSDLKVTVSTESAGKPVSIEL